MIDFCEIPLAVTIFTYKNDKDYALYSIRSVKANLPNARIFVADDKANPIPVEYARKIAKLGAEYSLSRFDRHRNLNGKECIHGILDTLQENAKTANSEFSIKMDSDTFINNLNAFKNFDSKKHTGIKLYTDKAHNAIYIRSSYGMLYCLKASYISKIKRMLDALDRPPENRAYWPEDISIMYCAEGVTGKILKLNNLDENHPFCGLYFLDKIEKGFPPFVIHNFCSIIHFGDRRTGIDPNYILECLRLTFEEKGW